MEDGGWRGVEGQDSGLTLSCSVNSTHDLQLLAMAI